MRRRSFDIFFSCCCCATLNLSMVKEKNGSQEMYCRRQCDERTRQVTRDIQAGQRTCKYKSNNWRTWQMTHLFTIIGRWILWECLESQLFAVEYCLNLKKYSLFYTSEGSVVRQQFVGGVGKFTTFRTFLCQDSSGFIKITSWLFTKLLTK